MSLKLIVHTAVSCTIELQNKQVYYAPQPYDVYLNGRVVKKNVKKNVFSLFDLRPNKSYTVRVNDDELIFQTKEVSAAINVKDCGAIGDGVTEDTTILQSVIDKAPDNALIVFEPGVYLTGPLFLKSNLTLYLKKKATILAITNRYQYPVLQKTEICEGTEKVMATWEGMPCDLFASLITGKNVQNVSVVGEGVLDGNADKGDWWIDPKKIRIAARPHIIYLSHAYNVTFQGLTVCNSPSWTIHPFFSKRLNFIDMAVNNPSDSPNTDGLDPESCDDISIIGLRFSVGDDCIAIKSGKKPLADKFYKPCSNIMIRNCLMQEGHGAVTLGSEMSSGVYNLVVKQCLFINTDRGLRIKTRRGRGNRAIVDNLAFDNIRMEKVLNPFVINMFYYCDYDGKSDYVQNKDAQPIDDRTPRLGYFHFRNITCVDTIISGGYFYGLPEAPINQITLENVSISYLHSRRKGNPAMMLDCDEVNRLGLYFNNVNEITLKNVTINGQQGEKLIYHNVKQVNE